MWGKTLCFCRQLPALANAAAGRGLAGGEGRAVAVTPRQALSAMQIRWRAFLAQRC